MRVTAAFSLSFSRVINVCPTTVFYTGNGRVGRIVASAAARHLTPVSLELGGKSPVIIDGNYDVSLAAKRVLFGKGCNAGQTCVAPDYILIQREKQAELVEALQAHLQAFYPESEGGAFGSASYGRIVNRAHFERLKGILGRTKGKVVIGGNVNEEKLKIEPTIVADVSASDSLMEECVISHRLFVIMFLTPSLARSSDHCCQSCLLQTSTKQSTSSMSGVFLVLLFDTLHVDADTGK
jgi:hypothetical protein